MTTIITEVSPIVVGLEDLFDFTNFGRNLGFDYFRTNDFGFKYFLMCDSRTGSLHFGSTWCFRVVRYILLYFDEMYKKIFILKLFL